MAYRRAPYTGDSSDYELQISAANGAPTVIGDANIEFSPTSGPEAATRRRAPSVIMISARFTGSAADDATWVCRFWWWNPYSEQWYFSPNFSLVGINDVSTTLGQGAEITMDPNSSHGYLEVVSGVEANQVMEAIVSPVVL